MTLSSMTHHPSPIAHHSCHPLVLLATDAITAFIRERRMIDPPLDFLDRFPPAQRRAGVFVCLKKHGQLRGCVGTTEPTRETLAVEVIENAVAAATRDHRFAPVEETELLELELSVDVLSQPESIASDAVLDHRRYGVIVVAGERRGILLPDIEFINSVAEQISMARLKAGINPVEPVELFRFEVVRYR